MAIIDIDRLSLLTDLLIPGNNNLDTFWGPQRLTSVKIHGDVFFFAGGAGLLGFGVLPMSDRGQLSFDGAFATQFSFLEDYRLGGLGSVTQKVDGRVIVYFSGTINTTTSTTYGLTVVDMTDPTDPDVLQSFADSEALGEVGINGGVDPLLASVGGKDFIIVASGRNSNIHTYEIQGNGQLGPVNVSTASEFLTDGYTVATVGEKTFVISFGDFRNAPMQVLELSSDGDLTPVFNLPATETAIFNQQTKGMATTQVGDTTYVFASEVTAGSILAFKLSSSGKLTLVDKIQPNIGDFWGSAEELKTFTHEGEEYLLSGGYGRSIAVFKISDGGSLIEVDEAIMQGDSLGRVVDIEVTRDGGKTFFGVTTASRDPITTYEFRDTYDVINGNGGRNKMSGTDGDDQMFGKRGADRISGKQGDDLIEGNRGFDVIYGGSGADDLYGVKNDDTIYGGIGDDFIYGGLGRDRLLGNDGRDFIVGEGGNDRLFGGGSNDRLFGGSSVDRLYGGVGNDDLTDGGGTNDRLYGGDGRDVFILVDDGRNDVIEDYEDDFDRIDLTAEGDIGFFDLDIRQSGNNLTISYGDDSILLKAEDGRIEDFELNASDFIFAE